MRVRRAATADAAVIAAVHTRTWQAAYEHVFGAERLAGIDAERRAVGWERSLGRREERVLVGEEDGRVLGFVSVGPGAGSALMRSGVEALRAAGHREAILWVLEDNPRARRFYEREGWALDGGARADELLGVRVSEVRYRLRLG